MEYGVDGEGQSQEAEAETGQHEKKEQSVRSHEKIWRRVLDQSDVTTSDGIHRASGRRD